MREIQIGEVSVSVVRKRIKNVYLRVSDGRAVISAPLNVSDERVRAFAAGRIGWIERQLAKQAVSFFNKPVDEMKLEQMLGELPGIISKWSAELGVECASWRVRGMKTRWGSCNPREKRVCLNAYLAGADRACLEYVVVHELAHMREQSHGPAFQAILDEAMPDWRTVRKRLRCQ